MPTLRSRYPLAALATMAVLVGVVLGIVIALLDPPAGDLGALAAFLSISGGVTLGLSSLAVRYGFPASVRSIRGRLILVSVITAVLALGNVAFTAVLMFLDSHDLAVLGGLLSFSLGMSILVALAFSESTARGMREMLGAVRRINAGSLDTRVPVQSSDEVGELASAFNGMTQRLEASFSRQRDLEEARRELVRAVSHDLRTPLASIRAMIESINDGVVADRETVDRYLKTTQSEAEHLSRLINDLFELSQLDAGTLELHREAAPVQDVISETVRSMSAQAASRQLKLDEDADSGLSPALIDVLRVQRVLYNLVQNAIRYTPPDGSISIRARERNGVIEVQVIDSGEGIQSEELPRLFQRSYRPDPSRSRHSGGSGLGLTIAKGIVEAHGGDIWVESQPGTGSVFSFTLPKAAAG